LNPLKNIKTSMGRMTSHNMKWKIKHVWNQQPVVISAPIISFGWWRRRTWSFIIYLTPPDSCMCIKCMILISLIIFV
jgi:hypothetical protein